MGSPLGPALANIFVGYYESKLFQTTSKPEMYYRYMDDTFVVFSNEDECDLFLDSLNSLQPSLRFTFEKESNLALPFLDVLVEKSPSKFITSIQARSQKFAMGGAVLGVWGFGGKAPSRRRHGGLGAEPPALENFAFFCKNNFILGLF